MAKDGCKLLLLAAVVALGTAVLPRPLAGETHGPFSYSCENGSSFVITFYNGDDGYTAAMRVNGGAAQKLTSVEAGSGAHYSGVRYSYDEWHDEVHLTDKVNSRSQQGTSCVKSEAHNTSAGSSGDSPFAAIRREAKQQAESGESSASSPTESRAPSSGKQSSTRFGAQQLGSEQKAIANMPLHWSKAQCLTAINNYIKQAHEFSFGMDGIRAESLLVAIKRLSTCEQYSWTEEQKTERSWQEAPFRAFHVDEQDFLELHVGARIAGYILRRNLTDEYASELRNRDSRNGIRMDFADEFEFLHRHGLMDAFLRDDDLQLQKLDASERIKAIHDTSLLFGLAQGACTGEFNFCD